MNQQLQSPLGEQREALAQGRWPRRAAHNATAGVGLAWLLLLCSTAAGQQVVLWHQDSPGVPGVNEFLDGFGHSVTSGHFNSDEYADVAIGALFEDLGSGADQINDAGAVTVIYGSASGLSPSGAQLWHQDTAGVRGVAEDEDLFGLPVAAGDFDGDGYDDLAISASGEDVAGGLNVGVVHVLFGSSVGLIATGDQLLIPSQDGVDGDAADNDLFGWTLVSGNFNGDAYEDLAVGIPYEDSGATQDSGAVQIFYGSDGGLSTTNDVLFEQGLAGVPDTPEQNDRFAAALATGDFDGDTFDDLAVGVPGEQVFAASSEGAVQLFYGSTDGLEPDGILWHQDQFSIDDAPEQGDRFGEALASCDFDADGNSDLAIGIPGENLDFSNLRGAVATFLGRPNGLDPDLGTLWHDRVPGIAVPPQSVGRFGRSLACGDLEPDGYGDLVIGIHSYQSPGELTVIHGAATSATGLTAARSRLWWSGTPNIPGDPGDGVSFGYAFSIADFGGSAPGLAIGVPHQILDTGAGGAVLVIEDDGSLIFSDGFEFGDTFVWSSAP